VKKAIAAAIIVASLGRSAAAFDNIEADAAYSGPIKEQIEKEFRAGLELLKVQADALHMAVREQDLASLTQHMYDKAVIMADCMDQQITRKKMTGKKSPPAELQACIDQRLKFMSWLQTRKHDGSMFDKMFGHCVTMAELSSDRKPEVPYSFLKMDPPLSRVEFSSYQRCYKENAIFKDG
jgi:hypothetical protein